MSAFTELQEQLEKGEKVQAIVFGAWGWGSGPADNEEWTSGYGEPDPPPVPFELRGKVMRLKEAEPMMQSWNFEGGYGAPDCYAVYVWTNHRVLWITQYDGSTRFNSAPRNPQNCIPDMPGG